MDSDNQDDVGKPDAPDRRDLLKKGLIGGAAAGVVWVAPSIEGFALRPDFAAAATGGGGTTTPFTIAAPMNAGVVNSFDANLQIAGGTLNVHKDPGGALTFNFA